MKNKPSVLVQTYFLIAGIACALQDGSRHWGQTASNFNKFLAFSPFAAFLAFAEFTHDGVLIAIVGAAMMATVILTTASDKWGTYLAEKLQKCLRKLESSARQAAQFFSSLPLVEKIRLSKIDFTSAILPVAPPPPRHFA
jgi:hypothetical protein